MLEVDNAVLDDPSFDVESYIEDIYKNNKDTEVVLSRSDFKRIVTHPLINNKWERFLEFKNGYEELENVFIGKLLKKPFKFMSVTWLVLEDQEIV